MRAIVLALLVACTTAPKQVAVVATPAEAPEPVTKPAGYVEVRVLDVIGMGDGDTLLLVDDASILVVRIAIGGTEGMAIIGRVRGTPPRRPLTHDLLDDAVKRLGGTIVKVHIDELRDGIFHGSVYIRNAKGRIVRLDSRASDAVALGIGNGVPIYVAPTGPVT